LEEENEGEENEGEENEPNNMMKEGEETLVMGDCSININPNTDDLVEITMQTANSARQFGVEPKVKAIHAGLECGLFLEKYPNLDMISIGPQMYGVHSPDERLSISSTQKCWKWLVEILKNS
jgi:dipeptidase D